MKIDPMQGALSAVAIGGLLVALAGCASHTSNPMTPSSTAALRITPADGATAVRLDAPVVLEFGTRVDRSAVENGFHLISEYDMTSVCPDSTMGLHGSMDAVMSDSMMLRHMDEFHSTHGRLSWNAEGTVCTFHPDSLMRAQTRYMTHMSRTLLQMMEQMGGGMMGGGMNGAGDRMTHFQTTTADEHAGHH